MNKELKKELIKIIKGLEGNILSIAIQDSDINEAIIKNNNIKNNLFLKNKTGFKSDNGYETTSISKLKKKIKVVVDCAIVDIEGLTYYLWRFIKNSYKLISKKIIMFGSLDEYDLNKIKNKYTRYGAEIETKKVGDYYILIIDVSNLEIKWYKRIGYSIKDLFIDILDAIGNGLMQ